MADLWRHEGREASIHFAEFNIQSTLNNVNDHAVAGFYYFEKDNVKAGQSTLSYAKHCKAMLKSKRGAAMLFRLFSSSLAGKRHGKGSRSADQENALATVGSRVVIADETFSQDQEIHGQSRNLFLSTEFHFPTTSIEMVSNSTQYLQISCPNLKSDQMLFTPQGTPVFDRIDIVSRVCLFNDDILNSSLLSCQEGGVDPAMLNTGPTLQEMEYIARSSSTMADVAAMFSTRLQESRSNVVVALRLDIPSFQYYHLVIERFRMRLCSAKTALEWMDAVDLRRDQIAKVYTGMVQHELERRGILRDYEIYTTSKSNFLARSTREALRLGRCPCLKDVLEGLDGEEDGLWRNFYRHVPTEETPQTWKDLGYLFYVLEVVRSALVEWVVPGTQCGVAHDKSMSALADSMLMKPHRLIVSVDDAAERRIYAKAQNVLKKIRASALGFTEPTLIEVYLCRRIFVNGNKFKTHFYNHNPKPELLVLSQPAEHRKVKACSVKPIDVVRQLHGTSCALYLSSLLNMVGLQ